MPAQARPHQQRQQQPAHQVERHVEQGVSRGDLERLPEERVVRAGAGNCPARPRMGRVSKSQSVKLAHNESSIGPAVKAKKPTSQGAIVR